MVTAVFLGGALLLTAVSVGCAGAASLRHPRSWRRISFAALMAASTGAMVVPMLAPGVSIGTTGPPIGWAAVLVLAALLALPTGLRRPEAAMTAASCLVMAVMWLAMGTPSTAATGEGPLTAHLHTGAPAAPFEVLLGVVALVCAALFTALAVRGWWRESATARGIRIASLHHPTMGLGMVLMGLGMTAAALLG